MTTLSDKLLAVPVRENCKNCNRCPDYDEDCKKVENHLACFIGSEVTDGIAKGYCPFIHPEN